MLLDCFGVSRLSGVDAEEDLLPREPTLASECPVILREWNELDAFLIHVDVFGGRSTNIPADVLMTDEVTRGVLWI